MPAVPRIEVATEKSVAINYPLNAASSISILLESEKWNEIKVLIEAAGVDLIYLHSKKAIF